MAIKETVAVITVQFSLSSGYGATELADWIDHVERRLSAPNRDDEAPMSYAVAKVIEGRLVDAS